MTDILAALRWLLVLEIAGLVGIPLAKCLFAHLPDRGHAFARPLALLLACYALWLLGVFGLLTVQATSLLFCLGLVLVLGLLLGGRLRLSAEEGRSALIVEAVFLLAFVLATFVRAHNPNIEATEKPMEFAFLNAILRSETMPPHDPWLAGYALSYYYFGYLMLAALAKLSAVSAAQAFNLGIATLFALTVTGAFGIVRNLVAQHGQRRPDEAAPSFFGGVAALALAVMGNLEGFLDVLHSRGLLPASFWRWLDIKDLLEPPVPGPWLPDRYLWWWRASRVINDRSPLGEPIEVIDEFPSFSFILGDVHPHVLALPFVLLTIAVCLEWMLRLREEPSLPSHRRFLVLAAITMGGLGFLNTWDWPIYLVLFAAATWLALSTLTVPARLWQTVRIAAFAGICGVIAYLPFYLGLQSQASGVAPTLYAHTKLRQFVVMFGPFLFVAALFAGVRLWQLRLGLLRRVAFWWLLLFLMPFLFLGLIGLGVLALPTGQATLEQLRGVAEVRQVVGDKPWPEVIANLLWAKASAPWMVLVVTGIAAAALAVVEREEPNPHPLPEMRREATSSLPLAECEGTRPFPDVQVNNSPFRPQEGGWGGRSLPADFAMAMIAIGILLTWAVEFVYLRDYFGTRMNTIFKFYYQAWVLLALGCSFGAYYLWQWLRGPVRLAFTALAMLFLALGMVYPLLATWTKTEGFSGSPTLDGTRYLEQAMPADYQAIRWLNANVRGTPVIAEATGGSYTAFARISANTGLPTILGWDFHEMQWRGTTRFLERQEDVRLIYLARSWEEVQNILNEYDVRYVYVGPLERQAYGPQAGELVAAKLPLAYEAAAGDQTVQVYEVR